MNLHEVLGVEEASHIEVKGYPERFMVGYYRLVLDGKGYRDVLEKVLQAGLLYRPIEDSDPTEDEAKKLEALRIIHDNKGWIARDRGSPYVWFYPSKPTRETYHWNLRGASAIRLMQLSIPDSKAFDLSKPIKDQSIEASWRRVTGNTWEEVI